MSAYDSVPVRCRLPFLLSVNRRTACARAVWLNVPYRQVGCAVLSVWMRRVVRLDARCCMCISWDLGRRYVKWIHWSYWWCLVPGGQLVYALCSFSKQ